MHLKVSSSVWKAVTAHAKKEAPYEACGYLAAKDGMVVSHYELTNTDQAADHFSMEPKEQFAAVKEMREQGLNLRAVYHSHPLTPARPSAEDIRLAHDPGVSYVIVSLAENEVMIKSFRIRKGEIMAEAIEIIDAE